ncbi:HlyD family type I secretion periplasmic adaptor subunit [Algihabitans albus]|uniref:HlyD family type I secretion periplasmic adaptor subunit n=1 Tax=Algihabitans albus TaxID=2164067 RepID=UPI000E5C9D97|nr:HlyD family type I secretion periplasmic adaptor subunit [Algihabitans albus]
MRSDETFMSELAAARHRRPRLAAQLLLFAIAGFVVWAVIWAAHAEIDQVSSGTGRVIPSRQIQVVQNLEGGILSELLVREGERVEAGQVLMHLDDTQLTSDFGENQVKALGLQAVVARLQAELSDEPLRFPAAVQDAMPQVTEAEAALYDARANELTSALNRLGEQLNQKHRELEETDARIVQLTRSVDLTRQEIGILAPLVERGINAPIDLIRLRREENQYVGDLAVAEKTRERLQAGLAEIEAETAETRAQFRSRALQELNEAQVNLQALQQVLTSRGDRVQRAVIRAPTTGTVKQLFVTTLGGVVRPGQDLVEIVPTEDTLLVEARLRPADIAFIYPSQAAKVKITAYDFTVYGVLPASVEHISADTIQDEASGESFYLVRVKTDVAQLQDKQGVSLPVIPGMTAAVDILTGKRTVLQYILNPFLKVGQRALREG